MFKYFDDKYGDEFNWGIEGIIVHLFNNLIGIQFI